MIRLATEAEVELHLNSRNIDFIPSSITCYIVQQGDHSMLATLKSVGGGVAEVHVCCPRQSAIKSRDMCAEFMLFVKSLGFLMIKTDASDEYRAAQNMLIKLGFVRYNQSNFARVL